MDVYKKSLIKHFGKHVLKHSKDILFYLRCVENKLKPSFLFDYACVPAETMKIFLDELFSLDILQNPLDVLAIDDEIFIYKRESLLRYLLPTKELLNKGKGPVLIDVSPTLETPKLTEDSTYIAGIIDTIIEQLSPEDKRSSETVHDGGQAVCLVKLNLPDSVNRTSVYGLLLGYPTIYWYQISDNTEGRNCLDYVPLCVHDISSSLLLHSSEKINYVGSVCKFSYPQELSFYVSEMIESWFEKIRSDNVDFELSLKTETQTLPSVAM